MGGAVDNGNMGAGPNQPQVQQPLGGFKPQGPMQGGRGGMGGMRPYQGMGGMGGMGKPGNMGGLGQSNPYTSFPGPGAPMQPNMGQQPGQMTPQMMDQIKQMYPGTAGPGAPPQGFGQQLSDGTYANQMPQGSPPQGGMGQPISGMYPGMGQPISGMPMNPAQPPQGPQQGIAGIPQPQPMQGMQGLQSMLQGKNI